MTPRTPVPGGAVLVAVAACAVLGVAPAPSAAAPADSLQAAPHVYARQLGAHRFAGTPGIPAPFLSTYLRSNTGVAKTTGMEIAIYDFQDPPSLVTTKDGDLAYLIQEFGYQQRIGRDFAVRASLSASGRMGTKTPALLLEGVSVITGWTAGGTVRLVEKPGFMLSGAVDAVGNALTIVSPRAFVEDVIANGITDTTNSLAEDFKNTRMSTGLRAAWGRSTMLGFLVSADLGFQEPYDKKREDTEVFWMANGTVSLDMREKWGPDIGFELGGSYRSTSSRNEDLGGGGWITNFGVFYTGKADFTAGLQGLYTRLTRSDSTDRFGAYGLSLLLRYDFS